MPQQSPLKTWLNASQNMKNGQFTQAAPPNPCIQKLPLKLKKPGLYSF
jgi:hypothetical protein